MEKIDFDKVYMVYDSLFQAFNSSEENEVDDDGDELLNPRMLSLWTLFLVSVGWDEDEFWTELEAQAEKPECASCEAEQDGFEALSELDTSTFTGYKKDGKPTLN